MLERPESALLANLSRLAELEPQPRVLLDEADGLVGEAMALFLTQLRLHRAQPRAVPGQRGADGVAAEVGELLAQQRIVNGGESIGREYGLGEGRSSWWCSGRTDATRSR